MRILSLLMFPVLFLASAGAVVALDIGLPPEVASTAPYVMAVLGGLLSWRFKRSRCVFAMALLALGFWFVNTFLQAGVGTDALGQVAYAAYACAFPVFGLLLAIMGDRGLVTPWGILYLSTAGLLTACVFAVTDGFFGLMSYEGVAGIQVAVAKMLHARVLPPWTDRWTWLPQPALVGCFFAGCVFLILTIVREEPLDGGFWGLTLGVGAGLHYAGSGQAPALFFSAAGASLIAPLFQDSYRMAFLDELTGLPSRRSLVADFKKLGGRYAVAMGDVDHFKKFNDTYGHDVGDEVLRMVASKLDRVTGGGCSYRYGGEEFTILFPRADAAEALPHLEAVRAAIENAPFTLRSKNRPETKPKKPSSKNAGNKTVSVTISIGVAQRTDSRQSPEDVLKEADKALYKAKQKGRNQVFAAS
ncbi:sensor domain-containing diguanylate cyclase [Desulfobaculum sp.]